MRGKTTEVERLTQQYELSSGVYVLLVAKKPKQSVRYASQLYKQISQVIDLMTGKLYLYFCEQ